MRKAISILDKDYKQWVKALVVRYRQSQIKAAIKVNTEQLMFNLSLGKENKLFLLSLNRNFRTF